MTKRKLKAALKKACKVRDQWCAEYVRVRDELAQLRGSATSSAGSRRSRRACS